MIVREIGPRGGTRAGCRGRVEVDIGIPVCSDVTPAGHVVACLGVEPDHRWRHALGIDQVTARIRRLFRYHRRVRPPARHDHVHGDAGAAELASVAHGHRLHTGLGSPEGLPTDKQHPVEARRYVDDSAVVLIDHVWQHVVAQVPRTGEVDAHDPIPNLRTQLVGPDRLRQVVRAHEIHADARVVHERVHGAEPRERRLADVDGRDLRTFVQESPRQPRSDAASCARDDRDLAIQSASHRCS